MRKLSLLLFVLITSLARAQTVIPYSGLRSFTTAIIATDVGVPISNAAISYHKLTWTVAGTVATCAVQVDSSADGSTWNNAGAVASQTCTTAGASSVANVTTSYIRIKVTAISGGGSVTAVWTGYVNTPISGGGGTVTSSGSPVAGNIPKFTTATDIAPAASTDLAALFCATSSTQYLGADGACHIIPASGLLTYFLQHTAASPTVAGYLELLTTTDSTRTTQNFTTPANGAVLQNWITDGGVPGLAFLSDGVVHVHLHGKVTAVTGGRTYKVYAQIWEADSSGVDIAKITDTESSATFTASEAELDITGIITSTYNFASTASRVVVRVICIEAGGSSNTTLTLYYGGTTGVPPQSIDVRVELPVPAAATLTATAPLSFNAPTGVLSIPVSTDTVDGYLSAVDHSILTGLVGQTGQTPQYIAPQVVSGCSVEYVTDLTYVVGACTYQIAGVTYSIPTLSTLTLDAADGTDPRIDVIAVDDTSTAIIIKGTAATPAEQPTVDSATQLNLTFAYIPALATAPSNVTRYDIYHSNVEWTTSRSGTVFTLASANNPYAGDYPVNTVDVEATAVALNGWVQFADPSGTVDLSTSNTLNFYIRSKAAWNVARTLSLNWRNAGTIRGATIVLRDGQFGFSSSNTTTYQAISIPTSLFGIAGIPVNQLRATVTGGTCTGTCTIGFYLDDITLQGGSTTTPLPSNIMTRGAELWSATTAYPTNAAVTYLGMQYVALLANTGQTPATGSTYWFQTNPNATTVNSAALPVSAHATKTNAGSQVVAAAYSDLVALWASGSCTGLLNYDGTCVAAGGVGVHGTPVAGQFATWFDATHVQGVWPGVIPTTVTGATLTFTGSGATGDQGGIYILNYATAAAATLPTAGGTHFNDNYYVGLSNVGAGTWTITTTTSTISKNGGTPGATATVAQYENCALTSDNANYFLNCSESSSGGAGANTALSNLASVAINTSLLPSGVGVSSLGSETYPFQTINLAGTVDSGSKYGGTHITMQVNNPAATPPFPADVTGAWLDYDGVYTDGGALTSSHFYIHKFVAEEDYAFFIDMLNYNTYIPYNLAQGTSAYHNFGVDAGPTGTVGASGYGIRDNAGVMELKNSGGAWASPVTSLPPDVFSVTAGVATFGPQPPDTEFASPPSTAPAVVQTSAFVNNTGSGDFDIPLTTYKVTAGHSLVVRVVGSSAAITSVTDDHSDTFALVYNESTNNAWYVATGVVGGFTTITVHAASSTFAGIAMETTPLATSSVLDASGYNNSGVAASITTSTANDLILAGSETKSVNSGKTTSWTVAEPFTLYSQGYGNYNGTTGSVSESLTSVDGSIVGTYNVTFTYTNTGDWQDKRVSLVALKPGASNGVPSFILKPNNKIANLVSVGGVLVPGAPSMQVPALPGAISYQGGAAQGTIGSPLTLMTKNASDGQVTIHASGNCTAASATSFAFFVTFTDTSSTAVTLTPAVAPNCTTLGPASMAAVDMSVNVKASTAITYYSTITSTPAYDLRITAQQNTTQ